MKIHLSALILGLVLLSGCAGNRVSEQVCSTRDWETLGHRDGANGLRSSTLLSHQEVCAEHGVVSDRSAYMAGWSEGNLDYCRAENGFAVGQEGYAYRNVCPSSLEADFLTQYRKGRELYVARTEVEDLEHRIDASEYRLSQVKSQILASASAQFDPTLTPQGRVDLLSDTQRLNDERMLIETALPGLRRDLDDKRRRLDLLSRTIAAN
ncbi:MAG: DUF2799 domain-containing protein [Pseudomonadales bacterium]|nr:DUF2799 domain-containing protein [Pseudomonadales bacterium]